MSDGSKTGGPAFPVQDAASWQGHGMTLRDYFAAKAMQAIVSTVPHLSVVSASDVTAEAYEYADAMLEARK